MAPAPSCPAQAVRRRRRAKARRPLQAKIRPGSPAPTMGPGTAAPLSTKAALNGPWLVMSVPIRNQSRSIPPLLSSRVQLWRSVKPGGKGVPGGTIGLPRSLIRLAGRRSTDPHPDRTAWWGSPRLPFPVRSQDRCRRWFDWVPDVCRRA
jgi:hypothetical protein